MTYIFYDFETSGRSARFDQILQAGFIVYDSDLREKKKVKYKVTNKFRYYSFD